MYMAGDTLGMNSVCVPPLAGTHQGRPVTERLDSALVRLGCFETREQAQRALLAGEIEIGGRRDAKPGAKVSVIVEGGCRRLMQGSRELAVAVRERMPYVSRGGVKLAAALDAFDIDPAGMLALDIGSSTGGFTDCLLQRGARKVYAVDCGTGQLHAKLRADGRVVSLEQTNARFLSREHVPEPPDIVVIDASFISLRLLLPVAAALAHAGTVVVALVKPQFEAGPKHVGKGGVVRDEHVRRTAVDGIREAMAGLGWTILGEIESPLRGPAGNVEYLLGARI